MKKLKLKALSIKAQEQIKGGTGIFNTMDMACARKDTPSSIAVGEKNSSTGISLLTLPL